MQSPLAVWTLTCSRCAGSAALALPVSCAESARAQLLVLPLPQAVHRPHHRTHEYGTFVPPVNAVCVPRSFIY